MPAKAVKEAKHEDGSSGSRGAVGWKRELPENRQRHLETGIQDTGHVVRFILVVAAKPHASLPPHNFFTNFPCARATGSRMFALPNNHAGVSIVMGDWHSWLARFVHIEEVAGSSPASPTANAGSGFGISVFLFWLPNWLPNKAKFFARLPAWCNHWRSHHLASSIFWYRTA